MNGSWHVMNSAFRILMVCTGNICRSPFAERLLQREFDYLAPGEFSVSSAGTHAVDGSPVQPEVLRLAAQRGIDMEGFAARSLEHSMIQEADLVLVMDRGHRRDVVLKEPKALRTTFTLREFARILPGVPPERGAAPAGRWHSLSALAPRYRNTPIGSAADDDVVDPFSRPMRVYEQMDAQVTSAIVTIVNWEARSG